ncbi:translation factor GTPase family protein [Plantactinospora sp. KBS50]|uniref:elongation factor G n=1 Tax=Plantactinospora sp. KBS50 TaxID=2024580 RepID=UPI000BAAF977|nr:TetM/TetW/TetO/TetS family tetracycline resistance ribosomal protection protein [Plantactinospora sp. KBS50]ASW55248.1 GTP-binding protein [Plantactinospora sp. KBS50]
MTRTLNLGILAHVDAGKTSLTERLLYAAGAIDAPGSVDDGSTRTDTLALERQRGITIRSAVVSFRVGDVAVNLIDTPGHPDFIAEVERALGVLDGAVLVVSAVEGVQAQTRLLMRTLRRLGVPTLLFVNKIDRAGARPDDLLAGLAEQLSPAVVPLGTVVSAGRREAAYRPYPAAAARPRDRTLDVLADRDDALLAAYVRDPASVTPARLRAALVTQSRRAAVHPVLFGSAITGAGVDALLAALPELLPAAAGDAAGPAAGTVFKVERGPAGEKLAYVRMFAGTLRLRDRVGAAADRPDRVTGIELFDGGTTVRTDALPAGRIGRVRGLSRIRIGDPVGDAVGAAVDGTAGGAAGGHRFAPPSLETVVLPVRAADRAAVHAALGQLAEQDPLINLRQDDVRQEISVSLYGEVQKEVVEATLAAGYGLAVTFRESTTICIERPVHTGAAVEVIGAKDNPFLGTIGLRVEPAPLDSGIEFRLGIEPGALPLAFLRAIEETVRETLGQGLCGWAVTDCRVTLIRSGYWARQSHSHGVFDKSMSSTAGDFRNLTPLVLMAALRRAGTRVYEPMHRFRLDIPADLLGPVLAALSTLEAVPRGSEPHGRTYTIHGVVPAARVHDLERRLPGLTRGEGTLEAAFDHHRQVRGAAPTRTRSDHNPLDRRAYLLHVVRRV